MKPPRRTVLAIAAVGLLAATGLLASCSSSPTGPGVIPVPILPDAFVVDDGAAWSPDGRWIVFHRCAPSSLGPPGLYRLDTGDGDVALLRGGDSVWPTEVRFSPDSRAIVCSDHGEIETIDLFCGTVSWVNNSSSWCIEPDWSHDGRRIVYRRIFESPSFWVHDLPTGTEHPLHAGSVTLGGDSPRWSEDDSLISFGTAESLYVYDVAAQNLRAMAAATRKTLFLWPRWLPHSTKLLAYQNGANRTLAVDVLTGKGATFLPDLGSGDAFSPAADSVIVLDHDPADSSGTRWVLFVRALSDPTGHTERQLTSYTPPPSM